MTASMGSISTPGGIDWSAVQRFRGPQVEIAKELAASIGSGAEPGSRVVVLRAPSGVGKTRLVREVYRAIVSRGDTYWPDLPPDIDLDPQAFYRKWIGPDPEDFVWAERTLPSFAWWHLNCDLLATQRESGIGDALRFQLRAHSIPLTMALRRGEERFQVLLEEVGESIYGYVRDLAKGQASSLAMAALSSFITVPGLDHIIEIGQRATRTWVTHQKHREQLNKTTRSGQEAKEAGLQHIEELAQSIHSLSSPSIPAVVAVEDIHLMSGDLAHFLDSLIELGKSDPHHRVVILATEWPEGTRQDHQAWRERHDSLIETVEVPELPVEEIAQLLLDSIPRATSEAAMQVAASLPNPHLVKCWLATGRVHRTLAQEGLTSQSLEGLRPNMHEVVEGLYAERWQGLAREVQAALEVAVASEGLPNDPADYVPDTVPSETAVSDREQLKRAPSLTNWIQVDHDLHKLEARASQQVTKAAKNSFSDHDVERFSNESRSNAAVFVSERLAQLKVGDAMISPGLRHEAKKLATAQDLPDAWRRVSSLVESMSLVERGEYGLAIEILGGVVLASGFEENLSVRALAHAAVAASISAAEVGSNNTEMLAHVDSAFAVALEHAENFESNELAVLDSKRGEIGLRLRAARAEPVGEEIARYAAQVTSVAHAVDIDDVQTLRGLAYLTYQSEGRRPATNRMRFAFDTARDALGLDSPVTLQVAVEYLDFVGLDGSPGEFVPLLDELVSAARGSYGESHRLTLDLQRRRLRWRLKQSPSEGLAHEYEALVQTMVRLLGPWSPETFKARIEQAQAWSRAKGYEEYALTLINELIVEAQSELGEGHRWVKVARWYAKYQIQAKDLVRFEVPEGLVLATPDGDSWAARAAESLGPAAPLSSLYKM